MTAKAHPMLASTYSIVARDPETGDLGVAVQSSYFSVGTDVTWAEPGVGAIATQSIVEKAYGPKGLAALAGGMTPADALKHLTSLDSASALRQVGMVDADGRVAAHTGVACVPARGQILGEEFSVQGNMLASDDVWRAMETMQECGLSKTHQAKFLGGNARELYRIEAPTTFIRDRVTEIERPDWWPDQDEIDRAMPAEMGLRPDLRSSARTEGE